MEEDALGVVAVEGIPGLSASRSKLLPMAAQLAHLKEHQQVQIERPDVDYSVGWSRGRETLRGQDTDWNKGSFYANPLCDDPSKTAAMETLRSKVTSSLSTDIHLLRWQHLQHT